MEGDRIQIEDKIYRCDEKFRKCVKCISHRYVNEFHVRSKRDKSRINSRFSFESLDECLLV